MPISTYGIERILAGRNGEYYTFPLPDGRVQTARGLFFNSQGVQFETDIGDDNARAEFLELTLKTTETLAVDGEVTRTQSGVVYVIKEVRERGPFNTYWLRRKDTI